jgi:hypothetical protein
LNARIEFTLKIKEEEKVPAPDYHIENGQLVPTANFLLRRDFCCGSGCRHRPYPKEKVKSV